MNAQRVRVAIVGPGNIGTDLMYKVLNKSQYLELALMCGIKEDSPGLKLAASFGVPISTKGIEEIFDRDDIGIVFDATTAAAHRQHAPRLKEAGIYAIDLTPAAVGPYCVPVVNLAEHLGEDNVNLVTCGGQATIPIISAISKVAKIEYAEIVAVIASESAGIGTRQSIDDFTQTTAKGIVTIGGARRGKAIILLNPAKPPMTMSNTIYLQVDHYDQQRVAEAVEQVVQEVQAYVPGYRLKVPPSFDGEKVTVIIEVEGSADFLPKYSGNLDIETCAALTIAERKAQNILEPVA